MISESDQRGAAAPRSAARASRAAPRSEAGSTGAAGAERSEPAVDAASGGAMEQAVPDWTSAGEGRSPRGCVRSDATTERTLLWRVGYLPPGGVTLTFQVAALASGTYLADDLADGRL
jgi:hypothetical protein